jgi:hypothetical protein
MHWRRLSKYFIIDFLLYIFSFLKDSCKNNEIKKNGGNIARYSCIYVGVAVYLDRNKGWRVVWEAKLCQTIDFFFIYNSNQFFIYIFHKVFKFNDIVIAGVFFCQYIPSFFQ